MNARAPRRHQGRLRPLTNAEREKRRDRRGRLNPEREMRKMAGAIDRPYPATFPMTVRRKSAPKITEAAKRDPHYPRQPLSAIGRTLSDDTAVRGGKRSRRRTTRVWR